VRNIKNGGNEYEVDFNSRFGNLDNGFRGVDYRRHGGTESEPTGRVDGVSRRDLNDAK
jgi:hypothetical protein